MSRPTDAEAKALALALAQGWDRPCDCHPHNDGWHLCSGHEWLMSDPWRRGLVRIWQRLLFMRSQRARLLFEEGVVRPIPGEVQPAPTRLPW